MDAVIDEVFCGVGAEAPSPPTNLKNPDKVSMDEGFAKVLEKEPGILREMYALLREADFQMTGDNLDTVDFEPMVYKMVSALNRFAAVDEKRVPRYTIVSGLITVDLANGYEEWHFGDPYTDGWRSRIEKDGRAWSVQRVKDKVEEAFFHVYNRSTRDTFDDIEVTLNFRISMTVSAHQRKNLKSKTHEFKILYPVRQKRNILVDFGKYVPLVEDRFNVFVAPEFAAPLDPGALAVVSEVVPLIDTKRFTVKGRKKSIEKLLDAASAVKNAARDRYVYLRLSGDEETMYKADKQGTGYFWEVLPDGRFKADQARNQVQDVFPVDFAANLMQKGKLLPLITAELSKIAPQYAEFSAGPVTFTLRLAVLSSNNSKAKYYMRLQLPIVMTFFEKFVPISSAFTEAARNWRAEY